MKSADAIVNPVKGKNAPDVSPTAVLVSGDRDMGLICEALGVKADGRIHKLLMSRIHLPEAGELPITVAGPMIGAPYATLLMETLIAWGAQNLLFFGCCGAVAPHVSIGDILLPTGAVIDEGTSCHYAETEDENGKEISRPSERMSDLLREVLQKGEKTPEIPFHEGKIWTTDAIYRETPEKLSRHQGNGVLGVEMELSALFTVGRFRKVSVGGLLVVSDELWSLTWRPGFKDERFKKGRRAAASIVAGACRQMAEERAAAK